MTPADTALQYIARRWSPIPIPHKCKAPVVAGWPDLRIGAHDAPRYFNGAAMNIGVILGASSGGLIDIDLDHPRAVELADEFLPPTGAVFGREGKPRSHRLYVVADGTSTRKWHAPDKAMVVELRGDGCQTVFPPSTHPNGELIEWAADSEPATVDRDTLEKAVDALARAVIAEIQPTAPIDPAPTPPRTTPPSPSHADAAERCRKYLAKLPDAVSGENGHTATFRAACEAFRFGLSDADAAAVATEYNARCRPPWSDAELRHKLESARARVLTDREFGMRLVDATTPKAAQRQTPTATPDPPMPWPAFPVDLLPDALRCFVVETAGAMGCDPSMVALPALAVVASAIGTVRAVELVETWIECAILWACVVARSGTMKSPAHKAALQPLIDAQSEAMQRYSVDCAEYEQATAWYEKSNAEWRKAKNAGDPPEKPEPPTCVRHVLADATIESIAPILLANPRGILVGRDELAAWLRSPNQYKSKGGSDVPAWLELSEAGTLIVDRKSGEPSTRMIFVRRAAASVCGTIQPGTLSAVLTPEYFESGFAARMLVAMPPPQVKRWTNRVPSAKAVGGYQQTICALLALEHVEGEHGPEPVRLPLASDARPLWKAWYNQHARRQADAGTDAHAAVLAKLERGAARFGLIFTLADDPVAVVVNADAIRRGCALADWFGREAIRVYAMFGESDEDHEQRTLAEWIGRRGGSVTVNELTHGLRQFRGRGDDARAALAELVDCGAGRWVSKTSPKGGRPAERFELVTPVTVTETPTIDPVSGGCGDGDTSDVYADADDIDPVGERVGTDDAEAMPDDGDEWGAI